MSAAAPTNKYLLSANCFYLFYIFKSFQRLWHDYFCEAEKLIYMEMLTDQFIFYEPQ